MERIEPAGTLDYDEQRFFVKDITGPSSLSIQLPVIIYFAGGLPFPTLFLGTWSS